MKRWLYIRTASIHSCASWLSPLLYLLPRIQPLFSSEMSNPKSHSSEIRSWPYILKAPIHLLIAMLLSLCSLWAFSHFSLMSEVYGLMSQVRSNHTTFNYFGRRNNQNRREREGILPLAFVHRGLGVPDDSKS